MPWGEVGCGALKVLFDYLKVVMSTKILINHASTLLNMVKKILNISSRNHCN